MIPMPWFARALKAIDARLSLRWEPRHGAFFLIETNQGRERWLNKILPSEQTDMMLEAIRRSDTHQPGRVEAYLAEQQKIRDEKFKSPVDHRDSDERTRINEVVDKLVNPSSIIKDRRLYAADAVRSALRDAGGGDAREMVDSLTR